MNRKFALYYGVTREGEKEILAFGNRGDIQSYKDRCAKDLVDPKMCTKYQALVLATDYGLKNCFKPVAPVKKVTKKEEK